MKKILFLMFTCLINWGNVMADNIIVKDVVVPQGGTAELPIGYSFTSVDTKVGFTLSFNFPEGIKFTTDSDGEPIYVASEATRKFSFTFVGNNIQALPSSENSTIKGKEGTLLTLSISAASDLEVGSVYEVWVESPLVQIKLEGKTTDVKLDDIRFKITIGEPADTRTILDETSTTMPEAATGVDVRVKRTLIADVWNTIVLPFSMTSQQMAEAFGDGVQLADFMGCETTYDDEDEDKVTSIKINFAEVASFEANHPYIIKPKEAISQFTVDGVDISPEEASVDLDPYVVGKGKTAVTFYNSFIGTYVANTVVPSQTLFLSGNKFWYSIGKTKMKAFRAYFDFYDILSDVDNSESKISFEVDDNLTNISETPTCRMKEEEIYNVQGIRIGKVIDMKSLPKGIYIVNGKKQVIK